MVFSNTHDLPTLLDDHRGPVQSLEMWMGRRAFDNLPESFIVALGCKVAESLQWLHSHRDEDGRRLYHGGLCPAALLVSPSGGVELRGVIKTGRGRLVVDGPSICTAGVPGYRSPEQQAGDAVDDRTDLFALGIILAELIAREPLQWNEGLNIETLESKIRDLCKQQGISRRLTGLLIELTGYDPRERPATARETRRRFAELLVGSSTSSIIQARKKGSASVVAEAVDEIDALEEDETTTLPEMDALIKYASQEFDAPVFDGRIIDHDAMTVERLPRPRRSSSFRGNLAISEDTPDSELVRAYPEIESFFD